MNWFIYIMTDSKRRNIHAGYCNDLDNTVAFYEMMPTASLDESYKQNILVYLEQGEYEHQVQVRLKQIVAMPRREKEQLITSINPDWMELVNGVNCHM